MAAWAVASLGCVKRKRRHKVEEPQITPAVPDCCAPHAPCRVGTYLSTGPIIHFVFSRSPHADSLELNAGGDEVPADWGTGVIKSYY